MDIIEHSDQKYQDLLAQRAKDNLEWCEIEYAEEKLREMRIEWVCHDQSCPPLGLWWFQKHKYFWIPAFTALLGAYNLLMAHGLWREYFRIEEAHIYDPSEPQLLDSSYEGYVFFFGKVSSPNAFYIPWEGEEQVKVVAARSEYPFDPTHPAYYQAHTLQFQNGELRQRQSGWDGRYKVRVASPIFIEGQADILVIDHPEPKQMFVPGLPLLIENQYRFASQSPYNLYERMCNLALPEGHAFAMFGSIYADQDGRLSIGPCRGTGQLYATEDSWSDFASSIWWRACHHYLWACIYGLAFVTQCIHRQTMGFESALGIPQMEIYDSFEDMKSLRNVAGGDTMDEELKKIWDEVVEEVKDIDEDAPFEDDEGNPLWQDRGISDERFKALLAYHGMTEEDLEQQEAEQKAQQMQQQEEQEEMQFEQEVEQERMTEEANRFRSAPLAALEDEEEAKLVAEYEEAETDELLGI